MVRGLLAGEFLEIILKNAEEVTAEVAESAEVKSYGKIVVHLFGEQGNTLSDLGKT